MVWRFDLLHRTLTGGNSAVLSLVADPGANSTTVDQQVTKPLEQALQVVSGVTQMTSTSTEGNSSIHIAFVGGTDVNAADNEVAQIVSRAQKQLPAGISPPAISEVNPLATPLMTVNFSGNLPPAQLYDTVTTLVQPRLNQVTGVGQITLAGGLVPQANVVVDPKVLAARGLTLKDVTSAIATENINSANGSTSSGSNSNSVSTTDQAHSPAQLANLVVGTPGGLPVTLGEVATVQQGFATQTTTNELNGNQEHERPVAKGAAQHLLIAGLHSHYRILKPVLYCPRDPLVWFETSWFQPVSGKHGC